MGSQVLLHAAQELCEAGYAFIPMEAGPISTVHSQLEYLLHVIPFEQLKKMELQLEPGPDGERDPDDGLIFSGEPPKDIKWRFHFRPGVFEALEQSIPETFRGSLEEFCSNCELIFHTHFTLILKLTQALEEVQPELEGVCDEIIASQCKPGPTSRSVLRVLHYPAQSNETLAKVHSDRSFLTLHAGDQGGKLFLRLEDGEEKVISPPAGQAVVFWGAKAWIFGKEKGIMLHPIAHGAQSIPGEIRRALVSFWHINRELWHAHDAFKK